MSARCGRWNGVLFWLLFSFFFSFNAHATKPQYSGFTIAPMEDWIISRPLNQSQTPLQAQPQRYLLVDRQYQFTDGEHKRHFRQATQAITTNGVEQISEVRLDFNPSYEKLTLHYLKIIRNGDVRDLTHELQPRFLEQEPELSQLMQTGVVTVIYNLPDIRKGDIVDYGYTSEGQNPVLGDLPFGGHSVNWQVQVDQLEIRIISDRALHTKVENAHSKIVQKRNGDLFEYVYSDKKTRTVHDEGNYPPDVTPYGWLQFSAYSSWEEVNDWAQSVYDRVEINDEVKVLAKKIEARSDDLDEYVQNAIRFVQEEIRYLGLEFGENSHMPNPPQHVLNTRYGDCKDKTLLLNLLLQEKGIKAYSALVNTDFRRGIAQVLPSPGAFDHVISYVEYQGESYWVDGTRNYQGAKVENLGKVDYGYALLIGHPKKDLRNMYESPPMHSHVHVVESLHISDYGEPVEYRIETKYRGVAAEFQRYRFANHPKQKIMEEYLNYYQKYYEQVSATQDISFVDDPVNNQVTIKEWYRLKDIVQTRESTHVVPINLSTFSHHIIKPELRERDYPRYLGSPKKILSDFYVHYPNEVDLEFTGIPTVYASDIYDYRYVDGYQNKVYSHKASLTLKSDRIEPGQLAEYHSQRKKLVDDWFFTISTIKQDIFDGYDKIIQLKTRLRALRDQANEQ